MVMLKRDSAAGLTPVIGDGVQTVVSCLTEAEMERKRRRRRIFRWRRTVAMGGWGNLGGKGAWEEKWGRGMGHWKVTDDMLVEGAAVNGGKRLVKLCRRVYLYLRRFSHLLILGG